MKPVVRTPEPPAVWHGLDTPEAKAILRELIRDLARGMARQHHDADLAESRKRAADAA